MKSHRSLSLLTAAAALITVLATASAQAEGNTFRPSRVRLLIFGKQKLSDQLELRGDFIPAGNLVGELAPLAYVGLGYTPSDSLDLAAAAGWAFVPDEPIASVRVAPTFGRFWIWSDFEINRPSNDGYYFVQAEYKAAEVVHFGAEAEGWGNCMDGGWSNGAGPNLLLRFGKQVGFDLALHVRDQDDELKPEFVTRFLLFL